MPPENLGDLHRAIAQDRLELWYQPRIRMVDNTVVGAEALLRLRDPDGSIVPPGLFLPLAEDEDVLANITVRSFPRMVREAATFRARQNDLVVAFNLSARDIEHPEVMDTILDALERGRITSRQLEIELTESRRFLENDLLRRRLDLLVDAGIPLAMDDFGTGHSNIESLCDLPIQTVKLDRGVVSSLKTSRKCRAIAASIPAMATDGGLRTVAEGIEDLETHEFIREAGYDEAQGYYYGKPMPPEAFIEFLACPRERESEALGPLYRSTVEILTWRQRLMQRCRSGLVTSGLPSERGALVELRNWYARAARMLRDEPDARRLERCYDALRALARGVLAFEEGAVGPRPDALVDGLHAWSNEAIALLMEREVAVLQTPPPARIPAVG